jgi:hypothetical protein
MPRRSRPNASPLTVSLRQMRQAQVHSQLGEATVSSNAIDQAVGIRHGDAAVAMCLDELRITQLTAQPFKHPRRPRSSTSGQFR